MPDPELLGLTMPGQMGIVNLNSSGVRLFKGLNLKLFDHLERGPAFTRGYR